jgi:hypothetical protein
MDELQGLGGVAGPQPQRTAGRERSRALGGPSVKRPSPAAISQATARITRHGICAMPHQATRKPVLRGRALLQGSRRFGRLRAKFVIRRISLSARCIPRTFVMTHSRQPSLPPPPRPRRPVLRESPAAHPADRSVPWPSILAPPLWSLGKRPPRVQMEKVPCGKCSPCFGVWGGRRHGCPIPIRAP